LKTQFRLIFALSAFLLLSATLALAVEPLPEPIHIFTRFGENSYFLVVENNLDTPVNLLLQPSALGSINFKPIALSLDGGASQEIDISHFDFGPGGVQALGVEAVLLDRLGNAQRGPRPFLFQPIGSDGNFHFELSFEDAYLSNRNMMQGDSQPSNIDLGGGYIDKHGITPLSFSSHVRPAGTTIQPVNAPNPLVMAQLPPFLLPKGRRAHQPATGCVQQLPKKHHRHNKDGEHDDDDHDGGTGCRFLRDDGDNDRDHHGNGDQDRHEGNNRGDGASGHGGNSIVSAAALNNDPLATGNLSLKYNDGTFHAAWGWVAIAWQQFFGIWIETGWSYVDGAGNWSINFPQLPGVNQVFIEYRAANRFVQLQDANANIYAWGDTWNIDGPTVNVGSRYADLSANGDLPNMDKLYAGSTEVWVKFYNNGMNALRDSPIEITFPNSLSSGHCIYNKDSNGNTVPNYAWSCSQSSDGKIWIISAHGDKFVAQHEIAHSIHSYYWGGNLPSGSGSAHSLTGCYNGGLALTEGFADFLAYWVQFNRDAINPVATYANYNIETVDNNPCGGQTNETWVSATFYDMYDLWNDGPDPNSKFDSLLFSDQAEPVAVLLGNTGKSQMSDYLDVIKGFENDFWDGEFTKLFRLDTIIN